MTEKSEMKRVFGIKSMNFVIARLILLLCCSLVLCSCALKAIPSEYSFVKTDLEKVSLDKLGNGKILIYNGADALHKIDNTGRLNIWINEKALGQIRPNEYVIIDLKNGKYKFKALHIDLVKMRSEHDVEVSSDTKVIKIKPNVTSNKLTVVNDFPDNFEKFKYAERR